MTVQWTVSQNGTQYIKARRNDVGCGAVAGRRRRDKSGIIPGRPQSSLLGACLPLLVIMDTPRYPVSQVIKVEVVAFSSI